MKMRSLDCKLNFQSKTSQQNVTGVLTGLPQSVEPRLKTRYAKEAHNFLTKKKMPRSRSPMKTPALTPTRRSARINKQRNSLELTSAKPGEMDARILQIEEQMASMTEQMSNISCDIESKLPEVTVALLTDGMEGAKGEIAEIRNEMADAIISLREAKAQLLNANEGIALGKRREKELFARIDQLKSEKQTLMEGSAKLRVANHRLERQKEDHRLERKKGSDEIMLLKDQVETESKEKAELNLKYDALCEEYKKSVNMLEPIMRRMTPTKKKREDVQG